MILLLDNYKQSLPVMQSLWEKNIPFMVASQTDHDPICYSRYCKNIWKHSAIDNPTVFIAELKQLLDEHPEIDAIFPIGELGLTVLAEHESEIPSRVKLLMPNSEQLLLCLDKKKCNDYVVGLDIRCPEYQNVNQFDQLHQHVTVNSFPLILKPNVTVNGLKSEKAIILRDSKDINLVREQWDEKSELLLEEYIQGERVSVNLIVEQGKIVTYLENLALHTQEIDGTGYTVRTISRSPTAILQSYTRQLMDAMNYTGVINIQFLYCQARGEYFFMEINPRMPATAAFIYRLGIDIASYILHIYQYQNYSRFRQQIMRVDGILCNWFYGDLVSFIKHVVARKFTLKQAIRGAIDIFKYGLRSDVDQIWSLQDPKPAIITFIRPLVKRLSPGAQILQK